MKNETTPRIIALALVFISGLLSGWFVWPETVTVEKNVEVEKVVEKIVEVEKPEAKFVRKGFCVDNDKGVEQYQMTYDIQISSFDSSQCTFTGVRQDIIGCTGDDFYSFQCSVN